MHKRSPVRVVCFFALLCATILVTACAPAAPQVPPTPTVDIAATQAVQAKATQDALDSLATKQVEGTQVAKKTAEAEASLKLTAAAQNTQEAKKAYKETTAANEQQAATARVVQATAKASPMADLIQKLKEQGFIKATEGSYTRLEDFDISWPQINYYRWWETGYKPENFVISTDASWESASKTANWFNSGCGFVFHAADPDNHYMVFLAMDGNVYMNRVKNGLWADLGSGYYGKLETPADKAKLTLAVEDGWITFLVNDKKVLRRQDNAMIEGDLAETLVSGTNKDYGTHCQMNNIDYWELK